MTQPKPEIKLHKADEHWKTLKSQVDKKKSPFGQMLDSVTEICTRAGLWSDDMHRDLPKRWEKHGNMILLPENCFLLPAWRMIGPELWKVVATSLQCERLGRKRRIACDEYRSPHIDLLYGEDGWVEHIDNGIRYQYDVTKCMFSIGNISEKLRIATLDCRGEMVLDMFSGIGYFTLPYLVHAHASHVYAVDWNPEAIEALRRNLLVNNVNDRCTVIEGDCRKVAPALIADRINLGLLPTAKHYWLTGAKALKPTGGVMHIHDTLTDSKLKPSPKSETNGPQSAKKPPTKPTSTASKKASTDKKSTLIKQHSAPVATPQNEVLNGMHNGTINECSPKPTLSRMAAVEEETVNGLAEDSHAEDQINNPSQNDATEQPVRRKFSRSRTIIEEIESKPTRKPKVDKDFLEEKWNSLEPTWREFAFEAAHKITGFLNNLHDELNWQCTVLRIGKIKSYAPHIDHIVLDLECRPVNFDADNGCKRPEPWPKNGCVRSDDVPDLCNGNNGNGNEE